MPNFRLAFDFDFARLVRLYRWPARVIFHRQGELFDVGAAVAVVCGYVEGNARLFTEVEMLPVFQFQRTVVGYFKAIVAHFVGVRVARVFVARRQFAHDCAIFAFHNFLVIEADVARCVVGRAFRLHFAALGVVRFLVAFGVGVLDFDFQRLAFVFGGDAVGLVGRTGDINTIALPLIFDAALFQTVRVAYFSSQRLADFGVTADADVAFLVRVRLWRRGLSVFHCFGRGTRYCFTVLRVVGVGGTHGDGFTCFGGG